jgi:plasmid maintenance system antidote protein VapI
MARQALHNLVNGKAGVSPEMAIRPAKVFGGVDEAWLQMQLAFDLAEARKRSDTFMLRCVMQLLRNKKELRPL